MGTARDVADAFYQAFGDGDLKAAQDLFADDCMSITPAGAFDKAGHEQMSQGFKAAFPDARMTITRAVEGDGEIYLSGSFGGTHTGDLPTPNGPIPASGKTLDLPFADYFRVEGGRIVAHETWWDQLTMLAQIGAMPS
jgi:steroid delta-isomerase-like uncharacterized protein